MDAYNVLHTTGILPPEIAGPDLPGLARLVLASRYARHHAVFVCDGPGTLLRDDAQVVRDLGVEIRFAGAGKDADSLIERLLAARRGNAARRSVVVSSDHRLRRAAAKAGAGSLTSDVFLAQLAHDQAAPPPQLTDKPPFARDIPLDGPSIAIWARQLGLSAGDEIWRIASSAGKAFPVSPPPPTSSPFPPSPPSSPSSEPRKGVTGDRARSDMVQNPPPELDPLLAEALKVWRGRLSPDDLDMSKWLDRPTDPGEGRDG